MKMTIDANMMKEIFKNWDRDYYTYEACEALEEWYDEVDPDFEFDVIAICCDWNEYGNMSCLTWTDFLNDYEYLLEDVEKQLTDEEKIDLIIETLEDRTSVIKLSNSVLVGEF